MRNDKIAVATDLPRSPRMPRLERLEPRLLLSGPPFVEVTDVVLTGVERSSAAWGDYDGDGDLDILLTGWTSTEEFSGIYRNDDGAFAEVETGLTDLYHGSAVWGDYDADGDLDVLLAGNAPSQGWLRVARVFRNDDGLFTDIEAPLPGVYRSAAAWGDYDNDGDLDLLLSGWTGQEHVTGIYRNEEGEFAKVDAPLLADVSSGSVSWGDYDNDGDLDFLLTGSTGTENLTWVYRNDMGTFFEVETDPSRRGAQFGGLGRL
jgi:hypothetical protein